jgi:hypothetical protein
MAYPNQMNQPMRPESTVVVLDAFGLPSQGHAALNSLHASMQRSDSEMRRCKARDREAIWRGDFEYLVEDALKYSFDAEQYSLLRVAAFCCTKHNPMRDVLTKKAIAWPGPSQAWLDKREGSEPDSDGSEDGDAAVKGYRDTLMMSEDGEVESEEFESLMAALSIDTLMPEIDAAVLRHPRIAVMPVFVYDEAIGKRRMMVNILTPEHFDLWCHDNAPAMPYAFVYYWCAEVDGKTVERRRIWTVTTYQDQQIEERIGGKKWVNVGDAQVNTYGRLPVALFAGGRPMMSPWVAHDGDMLADGTVDMNVADTIIMLQRPMQTKVLSGEFPPGKMTDQRVGVGYVVEVPSGAENVQVLDFRTAPGEQRKTFVDDVRRELATACGLNPDEFETTGPESGEARKMREFNRVRMAKARAVFLVESLVDLYWLCVHMLWFAIREKDAAPVLGFERGLTPPFIPGKPVHEQPIVFGVDVGEHEFPELQAEREAREERELDMGMTSVIEIYRAANPECPDDVTAEAEILKNQAVNKRLRRKAGVGVAAPPSPVPAGMARGEMMPPKGAKR